MRNRIVCSLLTLILVPGLFVVSTASVAGAEVISTEAVLATELSAEARAKIVNFVARPDVTAIFANQGIDPVEVQARLAALSDEEAIAYASRLDDLPAAGDSGVGAVATVILIIFLVLLLTDILGLTKVFPFTRPVRSR